MRSPIGSGSRRRRQTTVTCSECGFEKTFNQPPSMLEGEHGCAECGHVGNLTADLTF